MNLKTNCTIVISFFMLMFGIHPSALAQINIQVNDAETKKGIAKVELYVHNFSKLFVTNEQGNVSFNNYENETLSISIFSADYESKTIEISSDQSNPIIIGLKKINVQLSAIEIAAKRSEIFTINRLSDIEGTSIYAGKKSEVVAMERVIANLSNNVSRQIYAQVSGLNIYEGSDGGLQLAIGGRGLDPNRTSNFNTRQNGYDISADVLGYPESYYTPPGQAISRIQILRGASSLQYGTQFGGMINFKLRDLEGFEKLKIYTDQSIGSFGLFNSFNAIGFRSGKLSFYGFYNYKTGDGYRENSEFTAHNGFAKLAYQFNNRSKLAFEYTYFNYTAKQAGGLTDSQFDLDPRMSTRSRNWFYVNWNLYNLLFDHQFNGDSKVTLSLFALDAGRNSVGYRGNPIDLNQNPITALDEQRNDGSFVNPRDLILGTFQNYGAEIKFLNNYKIKNTPAVFLIGGKYYDAENTAIQGPGTAGVDADFSLALGEFPDYANQSDFIFPNQNIALFSENIFYLSDNTSLTPGLRWEYILTQSDGNYNQVIFDNAGNPLANNNFEESTELKRNFLLIGLGLNHKINARHEFFSNFSQNYRSVTFSDIRVVSPTFIIDPDIRDEKGFTADFGFRGNIKDRLSYNLGGYGVLYDDRIGIILDNRANRVRKNIGTALILGTETLMEYHWIRKQTQKDKLLNLSTFINAAFTFSEYLSSEENNVVGKRVEFVPEINIKTGIDLNFEPLKLGLQFSYISEQFTDVQNSIRALPGDNREGIVGEIPAYKILDFSCSYTYKQFIFSGGINNALNEQYYTRRATGYPGPGIIPSDGRSFYLGCSYQFSRF